MEGCPAKFQKSHEQRGGGHIKEEERAYGGYRERPREEKMTLT